jgi:hypothetical protein
MEMTKKANPCYKSEHVSFARQKYDKQYTYQAGKNLRYASEALITLLPTLSHLLPKFLKIGLFDREVAEGNEAKQNVDRDSPCFSISL